MKSNVGGRQKGLVHPRSRSKSDPGRWHTTEQALTENLNEDLLEAWKKLRSYALGLGDQRVYASGKSIMFAKKTCFFFVRPKKSFLELVVFLSDGKKRPGFRSVTRVSKTKFAHNFKLVHADQVEDELTMAIAEAFARE